MDVSFYDLGVDPGLVNSLKEMGITEPFEVQRESIPDAMMGNDICCRAPTGSGKTLAFGLPLIMRTLRADPEFPTSLILSPTRELADQIANVLTPLAATFDLEVLAIYGGVPYGRQRKALSRGTDIVVACPGRLLDLLGHGALSLEDVGTVVLDEADRMADMGFMEPVCEILEQCAPNRQTVLFSATLDDEVGDLVEKYLHNPVTIEIGPKEVSMDSMEHFFWLMKNSMKPGIAAEIIRKCGKTVVFCRTRKGSDRVGDELVEEGISVAVLHGGLDQRQRDRAMAKFVEGRCMALVATDVAARGIDVEGINCVIHYDPAENGKVYKHRSGRTARAGAQGTVVSLVQNPQKKMCSKLQKDVGIFVKFKPPEFNDLPKYEVEYIPPPRHKSKPRKPKRDAKRARFHGKSNRRQEDRRTKRGANPRGGKPTGKRRNPRRSGRQSRR
jgi:superfamily II DNA/RNA helicase